MFSGWFLFCPPPKLEDHHLSNVGHCLCYIFATTLHVWRPSVPSATWEYSVSWWQGLPYHGFIVYVSMMFHFCFKNLLHGDQKINMQCSGNYSLTQGLMCDKVLNPFVFYENTITGVFFSLDILELYVVTIICHFTTWKCTLTLE
jgi:hypothetical protein